MNANQDLQEFFQMSSDDVKENKINNTDPFFTLWNQLGQCVKNYSHHTGAERNSFGIISFEDFVYTQKYARNDYSVFWYVPEWVQFARFTSFLQLGGIEQFYQHEIELHQRRIKILFVFDFSGSSPETITGSTGIQCILIPRLISPATLYFFMNSL